MSEPERDRTLTPQGFKRAAHLAPDVLEAIMDKIEAGGRTGLVCREHGTSATQFMRRIQKEPLLKARWDKNEERRRLALQSEDGRPAQAGN